MKSTVLILTAIDEEYSAVKNFLVDLKEHYFNGSFYESGTLIYDGKELANVYIKLAGQNNVNASQETQRAISLINPIVEYVFFIGIAGGIKDVKKGDIVFASKIYYYEVQKLTNEGVKYSPDLVKPDYEISQFVESERLKSDWNTLIKTKNVSKINVMIAPIASGEKLVDSYDSQVAKIIKNNYRDTVAVEMEGFGFGNVLMKQGGKTRNIYYGVFRGISDIVKKEHNKINISKRTNKDKETASENATAFAFWIIIKHINYKKKTLNSALDKIKSNLILQDVDISTLNEEEWEYKFSIFLSDLNKDKSTKNFSELLTTGNFTDAKVFLKNEISSNILSVEEKYKETAKYSFQLAGIYELELNIDEALFHYKNCINWDNENPIYLRKYAHCLEILGKYDESIKALSKAQILSAGNLNLAIKINADLGKIFVRKGNEDKGVRYLLNYIKGNKKEINIELAETYNCLGIAHRNTQQFKKSIYYHKKSIRIYEILKIESKIIDNYTNIGYSYSFLKNSKNLELLSYLKAEKLINEENKNSLEVSELFNSKASVYYFQKEYITAEQYFSKSLEILKNYFDESHTRCGERYHNLAATNYFLNNLAVAKDLEEKAIKIGEKTFAKADNNPKLALRYNVYALILRAENNISRALDFWQKALEIILNKYGRIPDNYMKIQDNYNETIVKQSK